MSGNPSTQDVPASSKLANIEFTELLAMESMLADLSLKARQVASESGLTRREIAKRMGYSPSVVQRLVRGAAYSATVDTIARFAWACGYRLRVDLVPKED